jgi:hypothetical protein
MKEKGMATKKKTTSRAKKKRSTKSLSQTHGKEEKNTRSTTLDQIWGDTGLSKYGTMDESTYAEEISSMSKSDLQAHASTVGIIPIDNREMLSQRLLREFRKHVASYNTPREKKVGITISKASKAVLAEGR